jgi:hypothetical protein
MTHRDPPRQPPNLGAWRPDANEPTRPTGPHGPATGPAAGPDPRLSSLRQLPAAARPPTPQGQGVPRPEDIAPLQGHGLQGEPPGLPTQLPRHLQRLPDGRSIPAGGGRPQRRPAPKPKRRGLKIAVTAVAVLVLLPVLAVAGLMIFVPIEPMKARLVAEVKARTGRDLAISGPTSLSFYPAIALSMQDVQLSAPPGMAGPPTLKAQAIEAEVKLWPLLGRRRRRMQRGSPLRGLIAMLPLGRRLLWRRLEPRHLGGSIRTLKIWRWGTLL